MYADGQAVTQSSPKGWDWVITIHVIHVRLHVAVGRKYPPETGLTAPC